MTTSLISPHAKIGTNVQIGEFCHIRENVVIGDNTRIGDHCVIGEPAGGEWRGRAVTIGPNSVIRSHALIYEGSRFGPRFETGHHVMVREGTEAGENLRVGSYGDIEGACLFGDFVRLHSKTHVGRGSKIGHFVWLFSLTTAANDPLPPSHIFAPVTLEDGVVVAIGSLLYPGAYLRKGCFVASQACAKGEYPEGAVVAGPKGAIVSHVSMLRSQEYGIQHPWMSHYADTYPVEAQARLKALAESIVQGRDAFLRKYVLKAPNRRAAA